MTRFRVTVHWLNGFTEVFTVSEIRDRGGVLRLRPADHRLRTCCIPLAGVRMWTVDG